MVAVATARRTLTGTLDALGYTKELRRQGLFAPGTDHAIDFLAFTQPAPQDLRTAALVGHVPTNGDSSAWVRDTARALAAPFVLVAEDEYIALYGIGPIASDDALLQRFPADHVAVSDEFKRELNPHSVHTAKRGARQLTLFPIDARLLARARENAAETLTDRVESVFLELLESETWSAADAARVVIGSLASVIVRDKYRAPAVTPGDVLHAAAERHDDYFGFLAAQYTRQPDLVAQAIYDLADGIDYSAIDARSINIVYEHLMVTPQLRKALGIFYTPTAFANQVLDSLPIERIAPTERLVLDPACGSGNLLLAAQERIEAVAPGSWTPPQTHEWLKAHLFGWDLDPLAVEIARLSLLLSALPLGNNWRVETTDFLGEKLPNLQPTILVSNPPWHNPRGKRQETAAKFIDRSVDLLADGGLLACVLPATWLTSTTARQSRERLNHACEVFEVWRLPRDVFPEARFSCAVIFARKGANPKRASYAFRWIGSGKNRRDAFEREHRATYQGLSPSSETANGLTYGPLQSLFGNRDYECLADVATIVSGVVQRGRLTPNPDGTLRVLPRGAPYEPYQAIDIASTVLIRSIEDMTPSGRKTDKFRSPQVLVQAHRNPDTPWRVRPVLDPYGVVPSNAWHAVVPGSPTASAEALLAVLASGAASVWVHARTATKNIPKSNLESFPLPSPWSSYEGRLTDLGAALVQYGTTPAVLREIDALVLDSYEADRATRQSIADLLSESIAPEGVVRYQAAPVRSTNGQAPSYPPQPGGVLAIEGGRLRIWTVGGPDDGQLCELPAHMPGWLAVEGAVFDIAGEDPQVSRYYFHRSSYRSEEDLFGFVERPTT